MNCQEVFLALVRVGLWEKEVRLLPDEGVDFDAILKLAQTQEVDGLVFAGIKASDCRIPLTQKLKFAGLCLQIEEKNTAMNQFISKLVRGTQDLDIKTLLVKGQGVAQCYAKPVWRTSGDVDLLFDKNDYKKASAIFLSLASSHNREERYSRHFGMQIDSWCVEIHGTLRTGLAAQVDKTIDEVQKDTFENNKVRVWRNGEEDVLLPAPDNDVFFVFVHFLMHFYRETMCLRQLCDWCRLLWTFRAEIDCNLLELRLQKAGLMDEWKAFAAVAVDSLGMPVEAMPLYEDQEHWQKKGKQILSFILKDRKPSKIKDTVAIARIFPWNTLCFLPSIFLNVNGLKIKERICRV